VIFADSPVWGRQGGRVLYAHLISDASFLELHAFAEELGLRPHRFHRDHYDLPAALHAAALARGAVLVPFPEIPARLRAAGLRRPPRWRGRKVL
jgi:hypothetical protein